MAPWRSGFEAGQNLGKPVCALFVHSLNKAALIEAGPPNALGGIVHTFHLLCKWLFCRHLVTEQKMIRK
jgi:hypothetical protein